MVFMFLIGVVAAFASASAADTSDAHCSIDEECSVQGAVLLQRKGSSSSSASGAGEEQEDAVEEQLIQYTKLKQALSQSQESAHIMEKIDQVLDHHDNAHGGQKEGSHRTLLANGAHKLDDILDSERAHSLGEMLKKESETSSGSVDISDSENQEVSLLTVDSQEHARSPQGVHTSKLTAVGSPVAAGQTAKEKSDAADAADAKAISQASARNEAEDVENEVQDDGEAEDDEAIGRISKAAGKKVSAMASQKASVGTRVGLSEKGYLDVARLRSNDEMKTFVKRFISELSLKVTDPGGLTGLVPYYSGRKAVQSFASLRIELLSTARKRDGWLVRDKQKPLLLQTEATQSRHRHHHHRQHEKAPEQASFLQVVHLQMVPDLMVALFGNVTRAALLFCTGLLFLCLLCRDERKATKGEYENPLDVSPWMPSIKEEAEKEAEEQDVTVAPTLKVVRGGRQSVPKLVK